MVPPPPPEIVQYLNQKYRKPQVDPVSLESVLSMTFSLVQLCRIGSKSVLNGSYQRADVQWKICRISRIKSRNSFSSRIYNARCYIALDWILAFLNSRAFSK